MPIINAASGPHLSQLSELAPTTEAADASTAVLGDSMTTMSSSAAAMSASDAQKSGFFDLSAELRNQIYQYALVDDCPIWMRKDNIGRWASRAVVRNPNRLDPYGCRYPSFNVHLLRANRQIHQEASSIFYGSNAFLVAWHDPCGPFTASTIRNVRILRLVFVNMEFRGSERRRKNFREGLAALPLCAGFLKVGTLQLIFSNSFQFPSLHGVDTKVVAKEFVELVSDIMVDRGMAPKDAVKKVELVPGHYGKDIVETGQEATDIMEDTVQRNTQLRNHLLKLLGRSESGSRAGVESRGSAST